MVILMGQKVFKIKGVRGFHVGCKCGTKTYTKTFYDV